MTYNSQLVLYYFLRLAGNCLESAPQDYSAMAQEREAMEIAQFVQEASALELTPPPPREIIRITRGMKIYFGQEELKLRPMSKAVLLLFLRHPEGIALKDIGDHKEELTRLKKHAEEVREALMQAWKTGDTTAQKGLQKELNKTEKQIHKIQSEIVNVEQVLKRLDKATPKELQQTLPRQLKKCVYFSENYTSHPHVID